MVRAATVNIIDLAGSERQSTTGATGTRLKEVCNYLYLCMYVCMLYIFMYVSIYVFSNEPIVIKWREIDKNTYLWLFISIAI